MDRDRFWPDLDNERTMPELVLKKAILAAPAHARWHRLSLAETDASDHASATCYLSFGALGYHNTSP